jgi:hypothetical protein
MVFWIVARVRVRIRVRARFLLIPRFYFAFEFRRDRYVQMCSIVLPGHRFLCLFVELLLYSFCHSSSEIIFSGCHLGQSSPVSITRPSALYHSPRHAYRESKYILLIYPAQPASLILAVLQKGNDPERQVGINPSWKGHQSYPRPQEPDYITVLSYRR